MFDYQKAFGSPCITVTEEIFYNIISSSVVHEAITTCRHYQRRIDELPNLKSDEQFAKAASPIVIQLSGMVISDNDEQPLNAASLIVLQLEGRTTLSKELHP